MISYSSVDPATLPVDALVVLLAETDDGPTALGAAPAAVCELLTRSTALGVTGERDHVSRVAVPGVRAGAVVLSGAGRVPDAEAWRRAAGAATAGLAGLATAALVLPDSSAAALAAVAEGAALGAYAYSRYRPSAKPAVGALTVLGTGRASKATDAALVRAQVLADAVHATRDLVNDSPADLYPATFAEAARAAVKGLRGVKVTALDEKALAGGGYGGLIGVGQGSTHPPRLVKVAYRPARPKATVALVGKGITFDSGGISLKPATDMDEMKSDMAGAATVLQTLVAAARLGLPVAVTAWLCLAENMPSGSAQRPSDVITVHDGTTVEVLNTDAEGRLVLADGLSAAVEEHPDLVVDVATLTGAQMVALGRRVAAVMGTDDARAEVVAAAAVSGEAFWPMPLPADLKSGLKSKVADLANIGERWGGMLLAGLFLAEFVGDTPWAHLDVAGPAFNAQPGYGYTPTGGTGMAVRTLVALLEARAGR